MPCNFQVTDIDVILLVRKSTPTYTEYIVIQYFVISYYNNPAMQPDPVSRCHAVLPREAAHMVFGHDPSGNTLFISSHSHNFPKVCSHVYSLNAHVQLLFLNGDIGQSRGNDRFPLKPSFVLILDVITLTSIRAWTLQSQKPPTNWQHDHRLTRQFDVNKLHRRHRQHLCISRRRVTQRNAWQFLFPI